MVDNDFMQLLRDLKTACSKHDWYYNYSDDHRYWKKGSAEAEHIRALMTKLKDHGLGDEATKIYNSERPQ